MLRNVIFFSVLISSCFGSKVQAQDIALLSPTEILKLVPERLKGFQETTDPKALEMKIGTLTYTLCEKNFNDGRRLVKILLFDFKDASIMYNQATQEWKNQPTIESDSVVARLVVMSNCSGWESFSRHNRKSQIFLGVCDRFFLTLAGENVELPELRKILDEFPLEEFPKGTSN